MGKTKIEWTDYTWNPITGCTKGCDYCYARRMATNPFYAKAFPFKFEPHFYPERIRELSKIPQGSKVFVCSMGELFGDNSEWTKEVFLAIENHPQLTFQVLTKQPLNLAKWSPFPDNVWVGVSATNELMAAAGMACLSKIEASVKFLSVEPLLSWDNQNAKNSIFYWQPEILNWIIIGQQTPENAATMPSIQSITQIMTTVDRVGVPIFLKNSLKGFLPFRQHFKDDYHDKCYQLRQEFPNSGVTP